MGGGKLYRQGPPSFLWFGLAECSSIVDLTTSFIVSQFWNPAQDNEVYFVGVIRNSRRNVSDEYELAIYHQMRN